jgi:nucleoside-diphosphate-sugar epimerase
MKIAVTGASGQLGSYLLDELSRKNEVVGLDIRPTQYEAHKAMVAGGRPQAEQ